MFFIVFLILPLPHLAKRALDRFLALCAFFEGLMKRLRYLALRILAMYESRKIVKSYRSSLWLSVQFGLFTSTSDHETKKGSRLSKIGLFWEYHQNRLVGLRAKFHLGHGSQSIIPCIILILVPHSLINVSHAAIHFADRRHNLYYPKAPSLMPLLNSQETLQSFIFLQPLLHLLLLHKKPIAMSRMYINQVLALPDLQQIVQHHNTAPKYLIYLIKANLAVKSSVNGVECPTG